MAALFVGMVTVLATLMLSLLGAQATEFIRMCYFTSWSIHRSSVYAKFDIQDIDPSLCTHLVFAFAKLDLDSKLLVSPEPLVEESRAGYVGRYEQFNNLKKDNRRLKTLLSVGGEFAGNVGFRAITENDVIITRFAQTTAKFLRKRKFDGLDIDWEYPQKETRLRFVNLLKALRQAFQAERPHLLLTIAAPAGQWTIDPGFDIPSISRFIDYANLMTYDYHVGGSKVAAFNSPLFSRTDVRFNPTLSTNWTVNYYARLGMPKSKMLVGVTGVGRRFVLANVNDSMVGSAVTNEIRKGKFYGLPSGLAYPEICLMLASIDTQSFFDYDQRVPYLVNDDDWVGYEDNASLAGKVKWMMTQGVAGIMMWSLDQDDFTGNVCDQGKYPLMKAIQKAVIKELKPELTDSVDKDIVYITGTGKSLLSSLSVLISALSLVTIFSSGHHFYIGHHFL